MSRDEPYLRIHLFGRFGIEYEGRRIGGFRCRRAQELLARLCLDRLRAHRRETLAEQIWRDAEVGDNRRKLRQALWQAQVTLGKASPRLKDWIRHLGTEWVQLDPNVSIELDVERLEEAALACEASLAAGEEGHVLESSRAVVAAYRGAFLEGNLSDWCILERERLNNLYVGLLERLMGICQRRREFQAGIGFGIRVLREDRARERAHRRLMRLYFLAGDRTAALRQFERCREALASELEVGPARRTLELARRIREDDPLLGSASEEASPAASETEAVLGRLMELRSLLREASGQVQAEIGHLRRIVEQS